MSYLEHYDRNGVRYYNNRPVPQVAEKPGTLTHRLLNQLGETPAPVSDIAEAFGCTKEQANVALIKLESNKLIQRKKVGRIWHYWRAA